MKTLDVNLSAGFFQTQRHGTITSSQFCRHAGRLQLNQRRQGLVVSTSHSTRSRPHSTLIQTMGGSSAVFISKFRQSHSEHRWADKHCPRVRVKRNLAGRKRDREPRAWKPVRLKGAGLTDKAKADKMPPSSLLIQVTDVIRR